MTEKSGPWEIAARIATGLPRLVLVVVPEITDVLAVAREIRIHLQQLSEAPVADVVVRTVGDLYGTIAKGVGAVVQGVDWFRDADWGALDRARSRLKARASVAIVADERTSRLLAVAAPALASWLAGSVYLAEVEVPSGDAGRRAKLEGLRERYEMSDAEAIQRAERNEAPSEEPEFAIWLLLLGRGDLVRGGGILTGLAERLEEGAPVLDAVTADELLSKIRAALNKAYDEERLAIPQHDVYRCVDHVAPPREVAMATKRVAKGIAGGMKDFKRLPEAKQLVRPDGAWFHFTLTVGEKRNEPLELVAYSFELVYAEDHRPRFVRFDLNQRGHANAIREIRSHLHPGSRHLLVPAPILDPLEAIELMLVLPIVTQ